MRRLHAPACDLKRFGAAFMYMGLTVIPSNRKLQLNFPFIWTARYILYTTLAHNKKESVAVYAWSTSGSGCTTNHPMDPYRIAISSGMMKSYQFGEKRGEEPSNCAIHSTNGAVGTLALNQN